MSIRKAVAGLVIVVILAGLSYMGYIQYLAPVPEVPTPTANPASARLATVVSAEGVIVPARQARLGFKIGGRVSELAVAEGDTVVSGQVLARLDDTDLRHAVAQAEAALAVAQAQLAAAQAGARAEEVAVAETGLATARAQLAQAKAGPREQEITAAAEAVAIAQANLGAAKAKLAAAQADLARIKAGPRAEQIAVAEAELARVLAGASPEAIAVAEAQVQQAATELTHYQNLYDRYAYVQGADEEMLRYQRDAAGAAHNTAVAQLAQIKAGASREEIAVAQAQVDLAKMGATADEVAIAQANVDAAQAQVEVAQAQVTQAKAQLDLLRAGASEETIAVAQAAVDQARAQLNLVQAGARPEDIAVIEAQVRQAEAALAQAQSSLDDVLLIAPFSGTIASVNVEVGEITAPGTPIIVLGDDSRLQVETEDLSELDVDLVRIGQAAEVSVDALPDVKFQGRVTRIAPLATTYRGDKVYKVTVELDEGAEAGLRWGMTAYVDITIR